MADTVPSQSKRESDVLLSVAYIERTEGPMYETHHWRAIVVVGGHEVCDCWCASRAIALDEAEAALDLSGVDFSELHRD